MESLHELQESQPDAVHHIEQVLASKRLHHAYVLAGPDLLAGKNLAWAMAESILCGESPAASPCACRLKLRGGNHADFVHVVPDDKNRIRIDVVRAIARRLSLKAIESDQKVVLIENADTMNTAAQNALLKTLEEPPGPCVFILTVSRFRSLLPTVRSRSQRIRLTAPKRSTAVATLVENDIEPKLAAVLAPLVGTHADAALAKVDAGAMEILEILRGAMSSLSPGDIPPIAADLGENRAKALLTMELLAVELRNQLALQQGSQDTERFGQAVSGLSRTSLLNTVNRLEKLQREWVFNPNPKLALESLLLCLCGDNRDGQREVG